MSTRTLSKDKNLGTLSIRPYARLLTMLGDQLIKNERIALIELIKNSYDADADEVEVRFEGFNDDFSFNENSSITIKDNGSGMTPEIIRDVWMNPAAPEKYNKKELKQAETPIKKRVMQGEKGIGRFAMLKLGKNITITTRTSNPKFESMLKYDFTKFDDEFTSENNNKKDIFLDEIEIDYSELPISKPSEKDQGTEIKIEKLKGDWSETAIKKLADDILNLTALISKVIENENSDEFNISIFFNGVEKDVGEDSSKELIGLIENNAVFKIAGEFNAKENAFIYQDGEESKNKLSLCQSEIKGLALWRKYFEEKNRGKEEAKEKLECGSFTFHFYIFDFSRDVTGKYQLNPSQKKILKDHRIYLYRDRVRVYPYGDPDNDWLNIDVKRGTKRAGDFFSNDQIVGWVDISQEENKSLRDKTNREGLIEEGWAVADFIFLIQVFLSYIKQHPYAQYRQKKNKDKKSVNIGRVGTHLEDLRKKLEEKKYEVEANEVKKIEKEYKKEVEYLTQRADITEDLAGVGLSVEITSHDIMLMMGRAKDIGKNVANLARKSKDEPLQQQADMLVGVLDQIGDGMHDIQSIFRSSKRRKKNLKIEPILDKIHQLYEDLMDKKEIDYEKRVTKGSPLVANTNDGVVMQVLINLFDNASYWLDSPEIKNKKITVTVDGNAGQLIFSDNGPGINKEDEPYIFEPFYSGKGEKGRGLGLYIARQLLEKHDYQISILPKNEKKSQGASFEIDFTKEDEG